MKTGKKSIKHIILEATMIVLSLLQLFPIFYALLSSFKSKNEIGNPLSFPAEFYLGNYEKVIESLKIGTMLLNSLIVTIVTLTLVILIGALAAYPLGRRTDKGFMMIYLFFLSGIMIPFSAGLVPLFQLIRKLGLMDSLGALIFVSGGGLMPVTIMVFAGFVKSVPREIEEAATMDGCGYIRCFFRIIMPLLKPATVTIIIMNVLPIWNDFFNPLIFISSEEKRTLPLAVYTFIKQNGTADFGAVFSVSMIAIIFPILLFLCFQKQFFKGVVAGAVKG